MSRKFPVVPDDLLTALEKAFPDKAPRDPEITPTQVGVSIGQQNVLDFLRRQHANQNLMED